MTANIDRKRTIIHPIRLSWVNQRKLILTTDNNPMIQRQIFPCAWNIGRVFHLVIVGFEPWQIGRGGTEPGDIWGWGDFLADFADQSEWFINHNRSPWQLFKLETQTLKNTFLIFFKIVNNVVASIVRKSPIKQCLKQLVLAPASNQMSNENYFVAPSDNVESYKSISSELYLQRPPLPRPQNSNCNLWWLCTPWGGWIYFSLVE